MGRPCNCCDPCCPDWSRYRTSGTFNTFLLKNRNSVIVEGGLSETVDVYHNSIGLCLIASLTYDSEEGVWSGSGSDMTGGGINFDIEIWYARCRYCHQSTGLFGTTGYATDPERRLTGRLWTNGGEICLRTGASGSFFSLPAGYAAAMTEHPPVWKTTEGLECAYKSFLCPIKFPGVIEEIPGAWETLKESMPRFLYSFPKYLSVNLNGIAFPVWYHKILFSTEVDFQPEIPGTDTWDRVTSECDEVTISGDIVLTNPQVCTQGNGALSYSGTEGDYTIGIFRGQGFGGAINVSIQRTEWLTANFPITSGFGDWQLVNRDAQEGEPLGASQICGRPGLSNTKPHPSFSFGFSPPSFTPFASYCGPTNLRYIGQPIFSGVTTSQGCGKVDPCPVDDLTPALLPNAEITVEFVWE